MQNIVNLIKGLVTKEVEQTPTIQEEHKPTIIEKASEAVMQVLKKAIEEGKKDKVVNILLGKEPIPDNSILGEVIGVAKRKFATHAKVSDVEAEMLAGKIMTGVMDSLVNKTKDGETLRDIMQTLDVDLMGDIEGKFGKYLKGDNSDPLKSLF